MLKHIRQIAKDKGVRMELIEGRGHTKITFDGGWVTTVGRHTEIPERTARGAINTANGWEPR